MPGQQVVQALSLAKDGVGKYCKNLGQTPQLVVQRVFLTKTFDQMVHSAQLSSKNPMKRVRRLVHS